MRLLAYFACIVLAIEGISCMCPFGKAFSDESKSDHSKELRQDINYLIEANQFLQDSYDLARTLLVEAVTIDPIIIVSGNNLTLRINGSRESVVTVPADYTNRKLVSHTALAALVTLEPLVYGKQPDAQVSLDENTRQRLQNFLGLVEGSFGTIQTCCNFSESVMLRESMILTTVMDFVNEVLSSNSVSQTLLNTMAREAVTLINANIQEAAVAQLNSVHAKVMEWKSLMSKSEWNSLRVIIMASHMPRAKETHLQYFSRLLETPETSGLRVIYAENVDTEEDALALLGTHLTDFSAGNAFWGDAEHMHYDILAQATEQYLPVLLPNTTSS